jgi:hypothetical protein
LPRIFVSHSHNHNAYCREFVAALRKELGRSAVTEGSKWTDSAMNPKRGAIAVLPLAMKSQRSKCILCVKTGNNSRCSIA